LPVRRWTAPPAGTGAPAPEDVLALLIKHPLRQYFRNYPQSLSGALERGFAISTTRDFAAQLADDDPVVPGPGCSRKSAASTD
jgi:hypothetical protein